MKKAWIEPGCITCGACEFVAPEIFEVTDISRIKKDAPLEEHLVKIAALGCPVNVIKYEE
ncbi:MAG: ferredoxin [Candidatus Dependentiae bacterium]|nr:ferredoxin [Candidatus Dependentiae bacterium]